MRSVQYPLVFDTYNFCSEELQASLKHGRDYELKVRKAEDDAILSGKNMGVDEETKAPPKKKGGLKDQFDIDDNVVYQEHGTGLDTGNYHLIGVVTHQGRSAQGGHYIGWVHKSGNNWTQYDDDIVTTVRTENILDLRGGGDWHTGYLLLYRKMEAKPVQLPEEPKEEKPDVEMTEN